jgi:AraC-like DNA-binding protein
MSHPIDLPPSVSPRPRVPHPALRALVESYHGYHYEVAEPGTHRGLPSSVMTVVLAFGARLDVGWLDRPRTRNAYWSVASGLHTGAAEIHHAGVQCGIQLGVSAAGARAIFGIPMAALAAEIVPLDAVLPRPLRDLYDKLAELPTWDERYKQLDQTLLELVTGRGTPGPDTPRTELTWAFDRIVGHGGRGHIAPLATELGWSRRHLSGQFRSEFGLSPKQLARVSRFQRSRELVASGAALADVAVESGFSDQAHLTREWRTMSGYTPAQWLRAEFPFVQDQAAGDAGE